MNCAPYARVSAATANVAGHGFIDVSVGRFGIFFEQDSRAHNLSGLAVAALWDVDFDPGALQGMGIVGGKAFDRGDVLPFDTRERRDAGADGVTIEVDGARSAEGHAAAE